VLEREMLETETTISLDPGQRGGVSPAEIAGAYWHKSSWSAANGSCVEVAHLGGGQVGVRDTKAIGRGPVLIVTSREWDAFLSGVRHGDFDIA
jgi:Domain of unknown function (DUF397)